MTKTNVRTERIELRASPEEKSEIERRAGSMGVGAFLRQRALGEWSHDPGAAEESQAQEITRAPRQAEVKDARQAFEQRVNELSHLMPRPNAERVARREQSLLKSPTR